jgi:L-alanine-DL-glutamate epimerase-like enolase superfamily enzyme
MAHRIDRVEAITARFPLPTPIPLGDGTIASRDYVAVRVTSDTGYAGVAYALTRGAPLEAVLDALITPALLGRDALAIPARWHDVERRLVLLGMEGLPMRAMSLVDLCLWDIKAQVAGLPLWRLLGGFRTTAGTLLVDLYPTGDEDPREVAEAAADRSRRGHRLLKLHCGGDPAWVAAVLALTREASSAVEWVLDAGMEWEDPATAIAAIRQWETYRPAWVEDPFRAEQVDWVAQVRAAVDVPIAAGDEVASTAWMRELVERRAVDVVRLDALTHGGISGFAALARRAGELGCRVSPHVFAEVHQHCVFAWPEVAHLEVFAPGTPFDCAEAFVRPESLVPIDDGVVHAPERPGLGLDLDFDALTTHRIGDTDDA